VTAVATGVVTELPVRSGQQVDAGAVLAVVTDPAEQSRQDQQEGTR
jgi:multidrug efflux pump subunit AcrA (membrane-fusion protein)